MKKFLVAAAALGLMSGAAFAAGDAAKGEVVAKACLACHSVKDAASKVGPSLVGVVGRKIGSVEGFKYSEGEGSIMALAANGGVWDEAALDAYIKKPKEIVPKGKMAYAGLADDAKRADLIAYLATLK
jgi:cytochrome c